jgi:hypothetical protein
MCFIISATAYVTAYKTLLQVSDHLYWVEDLYLPDSTTAVRQKDDANSPYPQIRF